MFSSNPVDAGQIKVSTPLKKRDKDLDDLFVIIKPYLETMPSSYRIDPQFLNEILHHLFSASEEEYSESFSALADIFFNFTHSKQTKYLSTCLLNIATEERIRSWIYSVNFSRILNDTDSRPVLKYFLTRLFDPYIKSFSKDLVWLLTSEISLEGWIEEVCLKNKCSPQALQNLFTYPSLEKLIDGNQIDQLRVVTCINESDKLLPFISEFLKKNFYVPKEILVLEEMLTFDNKTIDMIFQEKKADLVELFSDSDLIKNEEMPEILLFNCYKKGIFHSFYNQTQSLISSKMLFDLKFSLLKKFYALLSTPINHLENWYRQNEVAAHCFSKLGTELEIEKFFQEESLPLKIETEWIKALKNHLPELFEGCRSLIISINQYLNTHASQFVEEVKIQFASLATNRKEYLFSFLHFMLKIERSSLYHPVFIESFKEELQELSNIIINGINEKKQELHSLLISSLKLQLLFEAVQSEKLDKLEKSAEKFPDVQLLFQKLKWVGLSYAELYSQTSFPLKFSYCSPLKQFEAIFALQDEYQNNKIFMKGLLLHAKKVEKRLANSFSTESDEIILNEDKEKHSPRETFTGSDWVYQHKHQILDHACKTLSSALLITKEPPLISYDIWQLQSTEKTSCQEVRDEIFKRGIKAKLIVDQPCAFSFEPLLFLSFKNPSVETAHLASKFLIPFIQSDMIFPEIPFLYCKKQEAISFKIFLDQPKVKVDHFYYAGPTDSVMKMSQDKIGVVTTLFGQEGLQLFLLKYSDLCLYMPLVIVFKE